jgi:hypothetical protein
VNFIETAVFCENLNSPLNGTLSTCDVLWGTIVNAKCDTGFSFADGRFTKNLECLETRLWNDTVEDCQRKYTSCGLSSASSHSFVDS